MTSSAPALRTRASFSAEPTAAITRPAPIALANSTAANVQNFQELAQFWAAGHLRPHIHQRYALEDVPVALQALGGRRVQGKLLIEVADV
jgi:NADPH:quinone reductase-like Zn-dependent oxidoreductase